MVSMLVSSGAFFVNDTATTEIYTLSLHDALPICGRRSLRTAQARPAVEERPLLGELARARHDAGARGEDRRHAEPPDRKSTRLNSSHANISYADFCLKIKNHIEHDSVCPALLRLA